MRTFGKFLGTLIIIPFVLWILFLTVSFIIPVFISLILFVFIIAPIVACFKWLKGDEIFVEKEENGDYVFKILEKKRDEDE